MAKATISMVDRTPRLHPYLQVEDCDVSASPGNPVLNAIVSGLSAAPGLDVSLSADGTLTVEIDR
jgi:hypothetical protein